MRNDEQCWGRSGMGMQPPFLVNQGKAREQQWIGKSGYQQDKEVPVYHSHHGPMSEETGLYKQGPKGGQDKKSEQTERGQDRLD